jgi:hypothetical protein
VTIQFLPAKLHWECRLLSRYLGLFSYGFDFARGAVRGKDEMSHWPTTGFFLLLSLYTASDRTPLRSDPVVKIDSGLDEGTRSPDNSELVFFRGIPYAAPPVGELRWKPPQPPAPWRATLKADEPSAVCPQSDFLYRAIQRTISTLGGDPSRVRPVGRTSEDCLYLNVMTATLQSKNLQPVMLWIHGGGGVNGRGDDAGASLASMGAVVVTINYRLGVFGWLSHLALTAESPHESSGNYGLLDQIAALLWVRRNIAKFGGDPSNVTIFGQSSGGEYVGCLISHSWHQMGSTMLGPLGWLQTTSVSVVCTETDFTGPARSIR